MFGDVIKYVSLSVLIGSFIYLLLDPSKEIVSVWIASALIGLASCAHLTQMPSLLAGVLQLVVGTVAFTIVAVMNGWISSTMTDIFFYAISAIVIILIVQIISIIIAFSDSKKINKKLNGK